jgi:hypothetical protein
MSAYGEEPTLIKGGEKKIDIPANVPVVALVPATKVCSFRPNVSPMVP